MLATVVIQADPGAVIIALGPTVAVVAAWWLQRRQVAEVHKLVNSTHTELVSTKDELTGELRAAKEQVARLEATMAANGVDGLG